MPQDVSGYRTSFPTALPGGLRVGPRPKVYEPVGVALPGAKQKKAAAARRRRVKKATGYAYPPVGQKLKGQSTKYKMTQAAERKARAEDNKRLKKLGFIGKGSAQHLSYVKGGSSSSTTNPTRAAIANKAIAKAGNQAFKKVGAVVTGAIARTVFPRGRVQLKKSRALARTVVNVLKQPAVLRGLGVAAAGVGAYAATRKTKAGGALGDLLVRAAYEAQDKNEAARMRLFRTAVRNARARGPVSSSDIKRLAQAYGFSTTNR